MEKAGRGPGPGRHGGAEPVFAGRLQGTWLGFQVLPEGMDKETVQTKAEEVLALLADGDYTQVAEQFRQDVREEYGVTADTITQAMEQVAGAGAYVKLTDSTVVGGENESFDGEYAVAVLYCKHEKKKVVYQFSIDPSYQLIGFSAQIR